MIFEVLRWYTATAAGLVILVGTWQARRWLAFELREQLHWLSTTLLNLGVLVASIEALVYGIPGGVRTYLFAVAVTWLLAAVVYHPLAVWRARRRREG